MRQRYLLIAISAVAWTACHGKTPPPHVPAPPVAPATPPPAPAPAPAPQVAPQPDEYARIKALDVDAINRMGLLEDIHFDFDKADLHEADQRILVKNAETLRRFDFLNVTVEGHCDERGTVEYNLSLGERRAKAAFDYLVSLGVPVQRLKTVSYGKEAPLCQEHNEGCWARNRRAHFAVTGKTSSPR